MIIDIGNIVISKIEDLPFVDKYAGVVKALSYNEPLGEGRVLKKSYPVACRTSFEDCNASRYLDLCPDSKKKSVLYLEDKGIRFRSVDGHKVSYIAQYDLVCWLNLPLLGVEECSYSSRAMAAIINRMIGKGVPFQDGIYQRVFIKPIGEQPKNLNPFSKYTYSEEITQHLMYPYDYFVMLIEVEFMVDSRCFDEIVLGDPQTCTTK